MDVPDILVLAEEDRDALLGNGGVGVLSFAKDADDPPHTVPVSYGYDASDETFYFRLAVGEGTGKGEIPDHPVTFVVHGTDDEHGWWSVVASGRLQTLDDADVATDALDGLDSVAIPLVDIFGVPTRNVAFEFARLVPERLTGRTDSERSD
jgi:nitroimidazol reductase NimA-like FMN-containing flavoprotein (pyridoxamine 5'-phosphate oxidase superfamily)